jgi:ABC-type Mn2+/Zn2+ transport system permease subunit
MDNISLQQNMRQSILETIKTLIELFPYALMGGVVAGIICAFLGVFVVSQRAVFLGAALTQAAIAGIAFSFLHFINLEKISAAVFGLPINDGTFWHHFEHTFFSLLFAIAAVYIFSQGYKEKYLTQDALLGIVFVTAVALRILFIQKSPIAEVSEIESILKGDILFIGSQEFYTLLIILLLIVTIFTLFSKQLKFVTFDAETAAAHGINSRFWLFIFYLIVGVGISLTTRFVGDVFTFAYLILPVSTALLLANRVFKVFLISIAIGAVVPPIAIFIAFILDISSGPTAVVLSIIIFIIVYLLRRLKH